ncbi:ThuA domain-containing protein [Aggregatimonas sangjinii]|uniref:ThuA domain-containing protein n=1 Tax=Aggregatimonas sangjinii TaxID=2583587 RepID=A0A5B7SPV2_9FLAO|nr:ThuA domain-containing protein [Aggregatimonas sangjinii]QCX00557.1 ThuA domain-containing protein [Aggregatimonas sangjinii]
MRNSILTSSALFFLLHLSAQRLEPVEINNTWLASIEKLASSETRIPTENKRKILVFSKATGFDHWTIPHNNEMLKILAKKTDAFEIHIGYDVTNFSASYLDGFDAVVLNNSNPKGPKRDLFYDLLKANSSMSEEAITEAAAGYEDNLMEYVKNGGGLMLLHGAITVQNNSEKFSEMTGGSFDYHPKQQKMHVKEVDPEHPLVEAFKGDGFEHVDEPYLFKNAYFDYNFRPLLYVDTTKLEGLKKEVKNTTNYVSWIKKYGEGRVFYTSASHNAQSLENSEFLQYLLDGMQYVVGDLECDDSPIDQP